MILMGNSNSSTGVYPRLIEKYVKGNHIDSFSCCQIKWLLRDEIASAMLHTCHLKEANLEMVVAHVESSHHARNCISESIPLNFVCGMEQSKERFMQVCTNTHIYLLFWQQVRLFCFFA